MKPLTYPLFLAVLIALSVSLNSCLKDKYQEIDDENINAEYTDFDFKTVKDIKLNIKTLTNVNSPITGVYIEVYGEYPLDEYGSLLPEAKKHLIHKGISNSNGIMTVDISTATAIEVAYIMTYHVGLPTLQSIDLNTSYVSVVIGGDSSVSTKGSNATGSKSLPTPTLVNGYYTLGTWSSLGIPNYLMPINDVLSNSFLQDVNASLPETQALTTSHPWYLESEDDGSMVLTKDAEMWVTFVHEGAGWLNLLGYYSYPTNNPPATISNIRDKTVIFPNVSFTNSGGGLSSGNKVQLLYLDPATQQYTTVFPAGTTVAWFIVAQGWSNSAHSISNGTYTHYSYANFNAETNPSLKKHNVLLYDEDRELFLLGFEDIRRDAFCCDQDFNDAVFYATVSPVTAVDRTVYQPIDNPTESDNDGVSDVFDEYPTDPEKAFNNYYPAEGVFGTLVFEDLWPYRGDYDFNDLVLDYNFNQVANAENKIVGIESKIKVRAIGASYHNGFGIALNTTASNISSVVGQSITQNYINLAANGTENNQSKAVIIIFDDAYNFLPYPGSGLCVNTYAENPYVEPDTFSINIAFNNPMDLSFLGTPPYNPFIIINQERGTEVHLPASPPTDLANLNMLGTGDDDSDPGQGKYYMSDVYLPWAINIPTEFDYPFEKEDLRNGHLFFQNWALSRGYNYMDWYSNKMGYRNQNKIYNH
jgi:LruC domain-containing protein